LLKHWLNLKKNKNLPKKFEDDIVDVITGTYRDDASYLDICFSNDINFGDEWFYCKGSLYRLRDREAKLKCVEEYKKTLSKNDLDFIEDFSKKLSASVVVAKQGNENPFYFTNLSEILSDLRK
jgi:hypothetical protein